MMKRGVLCALLAVVLASALPLHAQTTMAPDELARSVTDEVLAVLRAEPDIKARNPDKLMNLIETKVLPHFNFTRMTQLAVGKNWRSANAQQRGALVDQFRLLLVRTYTTAFTSYRDQKIIYRPLRMRPDDEDVVVRSQVIQPGAPPVGVDYSMEKNGNGWKVYDVAIEGVSLVQNYRSSFNNEIQHGGIDGLIQALDSKNRQLAQKAQGASQ